MTRFLIVAMIVLVTSLAIGRFVPRDRAMSASEFEVVRGSSVWTMESGGLDREFRMYLPDNLELDRPVALVVMLHGRFQSAKQAEEYYGWDAMADLGGFVVAYPNGTDRAWNAGGGCCREPGRTGQDDVAFIEDMIDLISSRVPVDPDRVFAAGMSNGGKMAYRLACETDRFSAIAPVAALQLVPCDSPTPASVLVIHGLDDALAPIEGGMDAGSSNVDVMSVPETIAFWRSVDDCAVPIEVTVGDVTDSWTSCADGRAVELLTIANMTHVWPGGGSGSLDQRFTVSRGGDDLLATVAIWEFFSSHPRTPG